MTVVAPDWLSRRAFSASRTAAEIGTVLLSSRTVRVASVAVSSRLHVTTTARAVSILACFHAAVRVASAMIAVSPASLRVSPPRPADR